MKEEWNCATMVNGVQCVTISLMEMMLQLSVGSWDSLHGVRIYTVGPLMYNMYTILH